MKKINQFALKLLRIFMQLASVVLFLLMSFYFLMMTPLHITISVEYPKLYVTVFSIVLALNYNLDLLLYQIRLFGHPVVAFLSYFWLLLLVAFYCLYVLALSKYILSQFTKRIKAPSRLWQRIYLLLSYIVVLFLLLVFAI